MIEKQRKCCTGKAQKTKSLREKEIIMWNELGLIIGNL